MDERQLPKGRTSPYRTAVVLAVREAARTRFTGAPGSHDWDHTRRVVRLCERIGPAESADMDVLLCAAYLHDIGRSRQDATNGRVCHARAGADMAAPLVDAQPLSADQRKNIIHCIRAHRYRDDHPPRSLEAKVLFDADKLDAIGAVGVARAYLFAGEVGARLHNPDAGATLGEEYTADDTGYREYRVKLRHIYDRMMTATGRRIAQSRHRFMEKYFDRLLVEVEGED